MNASRGFGDESLEAKYTIYTKEVNMKPPIKPRRPTATQTVFIEIYAKKMLRPNAIMIDRMIPIPEAIRPK
jgi:hypothetical protein